MITNFENAASHKYNVVQTAKSLWMARSEVAGYSFLVIKNHILYFEKVLLETTFVS